MLLTGALAFAVGAPTIACMGGGEVTTDDGGGDDGGDDDDGGGEAKDAAAKAIGNWQVQPAPEDMRQMKIINMALNPKMDVAKFKEKLKPPPNDAEIAMFQDFQKLPPDSPEAKFLKMQVQMMKESDLEITSSKWILTMAGETQEWAYTVDSSSENELKVKLDSGEVNTLTFKGDNKILVKIKDPGGEMELQFKRK